jgi:alpha-tubulin suppressor-like RCC1 family protein
MTHIGCNPSLNTSSPMPGRRSATASTALSFRQVSAGSIHTCGVTTDNRAHCWGSNWPGQVGDGTMVRRLAPVAVVGGHQFRQVDAGGGHTCGVTTDDRAYCWGYNGNGRLGDGTTVTRLVPVPVVGPG